MKKENSFSSCNGIKTVTTGNNITTSSNKPIYNIDLFIDLKKDDIALSNNIYLKFYNEHTKKKVLKTQNNNTFNEFFDKNLKYIKRKQSSYKLMKKDMEVKDEKTKKEEKKTEPKEINKKFNRANTAHGQIVNSKNKKNKSMRIQILNCSRNKPPPMVIKKKAVQNNFRSMSCGKDKIIKKINTSKTKNLGTEVNKYLNKKPTFKKACSFYEVNKKENIAPIKPNKIVSKIKINSNTALPKSYIEKPKQKYDKKLSTVIKFPKTYISELELIQKNNENKNIMNKIIKMSKPNKEKEKKLNQLLKNIKDSINKYNRGVGIVIID